LYAVTAPLGEHTGGPSAAVAIFSSENRLRRAEQLPRNEEP
jgi:hypothetical protein